MKIRATLSLILQMSPAAWAFLIRSLQLSCLLLFCACVLLLHFEGGGGSYSLYIQSKAFQEYAQAALLIGAIVPLCLEDLR